MPGAISTREFTRRAQEMHPGLLVLYTSGYTQNAIVHNGKLDDDAFLLSKPYRKDELARKLRSVFAGTARGAGQRRPQSVPDMAVPTAPRQGAGGGGCDADPHGHGGHDRADRLSRRWRRATAPRRWPCCSRIRTIEILLTDLGLPGMNGRQLVEEARRLKPGLKVIIASGYSTRDEESASVAGQVSHLVKPFDMQQLRRALEA